ncbi:MAG: hypothetical protein HGB03_01360 [Candidatus Yonathbacteria bacterium]|nr:hypothetical protein [Candidatus Yonathbacteria bacterium]NTW47912.1 hypothetical protein [Candidatus Yonathbacteria bacterium]
MTPNPLVRFLLDGLVHALSAMNETALLWLPPVLGVILVRSWIYYVRMQFNLSRQYILLEIKLPKETFKSPVAIEMILNGINLTIREGNWYVKYIKGMSRPIFSLEMVSIEGNVRFFIRTEPDFRKLIETQIYAQYPNIEIFEASDYATHVPYGQPGSDWELFGMELAFTKPDPYPIKTYPLYGLEGNPKEEFKIDPIAPIIEFLGSLGKGEQSWIQIVIRGAKTKEVPGGIFGKETDWRKEGSALVKEMKAKSYEAKKEGAFTAPTKGEMESIAAIERAITKPGFDTGIRVLYIAKKDSFDKMVISTMTNAFKQFGSADLNGFKPTNVTSFNFPWQDFTGKRLAEKKAGIFNAYVARGFFNPPFKSIPMVMNTEELATVFHFPGQVIRTPTFERIESRKGEPPVNLPF